MHIILKRGSDEELNEEAVSALRSISGVQIEQHVSDWLEGRTRLPAIWLEDGTSRSGIDAINEFVAEQLRPAVKSS